MIFLDIEIWDVVYFFRIRFLQHLRTKQQQKCTKVEKWSQGNSRNKWGHSSSSIYYFQGISDHNSSSKRSKNTPKNYICSAYYNAKYHMTCEFVYSSKGLIWKGGKNILGVKKRCRDLVTYAYILITYWLKMFELVFSQSTFLGTGRIPPINTNGSFLESTFQKTSKQFSVVLETLIHIFLLLKFWLHVYTYHLKLNFFRK